MTALARGIGEPSVNERIHEYVRALEALVEARISKSKSDFAHRCQTFARALSQTNTILEEYYDIRSAIEHMNVMDDLFPDALRKKST